MVATVTRLGAAAPTEHYFERDGYYAKDDAAHHRASRWRGLGAAAPSLRGPVRSKRFNGMLSDRVPGTDIRLGRLRGGKHEHRAGVDVTFSAPKSVSLEGLVYARPRTRARVVRAHDEAVRATLDFIGRDLLQTRDRDPATRRRPRVPANGMVAATFRHVASRNLDPQLHTHCVIANMTRNGSGAWRSAEFTALERSRHLIDAFYRSELRTRLEALGYATVPTSYGGMGSFEIAGYPRALPDAFSTRRREVPAWMAERGREHTPARMRQAVLYTRRRKAEPDRTAWRLRAGESPLRDAAAVRGRDRAVRPPAREGSALGITVRAVEHLEERAAVFPATRLRALALSWGVRDLGAVDAAVGRLLSDGRLIGASLPGADGAFTTDRTVAAERAVPARMREGRGSARPPVRAAVVEAHLAGTVLNAGQRDAVRTILLSRDRLVGVQGYAGTGKTAMLREAAALSRDRGMLGLAPSAGATRVLGRDAGIPARTVQWFLTRYRDVGDGTADERRTAEARRAFAGGVLVVDEASMIGTAQMASLLRTADRLGVARVALVGDRRQLRSVEAGRPFRRLQDAGMATARMTEVLHRRDAGLRATVLHMIAERPDLALEGLGNGVLEMGSDELADAAARLWLDLAPEAREGTAILAPTHARRRPSTKRCGPGSRRRACCGDRCWRSSVT